MKSKLFKTVKDIPFTVIGLPGSGKTTVLRLFGEQVGRETVSTDMIFDRERAKPDGKITL
jgi:cytidylate kinase